MSKILAEVQILEAAYNLEFARSDSSRKLMETSYIQVFEQFGIQREQFEESLNWYSNHAEEMILIQEEVSDLLLARENDLISTKK